MCGAIVSGLHSISMEVLYIARSTWMCGAIVSDRHNPKTIATGCADPSYRFLPQMLLPQTRIR
jgi:hypothetical protein